MIGIALTAVALLVMPLLVMPLLLMPLLLMPLLGRAKHKLAARLGSAATAGEGTRTTFAPPHSAGPACPLDDPLPDTPRVAYSLAARRTGARSGVGLSK